MSKDRCGFCGSTETEQHELFDGEVWLICRCGHITKIKPNGKRELWVGENDSILISKVKDLE
jgi:hypothetical protein